MTIRNLDGFFKPRRVVLLGQPVGESAQQLIANLRRAAPPGLVVENAETLEEATPDILAIASDPAQLDSKALSRLAERGCRAVIWPHTTPPSTELLNEARRHTTRLLGPRSPGILNPAAGLAASALPATLLPGSMALIAQSQSVAAAAVDWATGRRLGFSWVAVTGGESDVDIADLLDYAALEPGTRAVAVEVGHIRGARKFMSAARACARIKPVVVLQTRQANWHGQGPDPVRSAAFARAGMVECSSLPALFDAFAALHRLPFLREPRVLIVSNGSGICALGVDAVLRHRLHTAEPNATTWDKAYKRLPGLSRLGGGADIGDAPSDSIVATLHSFMQDPAVDLVLYIRSPIASSSHESIAAVFAQSKFDKPLLTVWLGLETALPARRLSADAGIATFTSPDAAVRAVRYRWEYSRNRELLTLTPPRGPTSSDSAARTASRLENLRTHGKSKLHGREAARLLADYGIVCRRPQAGDLLRLNVNIRLHPELGVYLSAALAAPGFTSPAGYGFMPLDLLLARRILGDAGLNADNAVTEEDLEALAQELVRIGHFAMDQPVLAELELRLTVQRGLVQCHDPMLQLRQSADGLHERSRLALAAYPQALAHTATLGGEHFLLRPVRPEDEPAVINLLQSLDAETVRLRFFTYIRHFSHDMAARMTQIDYDREMALVILPKDQPDRIIGMGTVVADPDGARAEFAVLVDREHCGIGLGRYLLQQLLQHARTRGIGAVFGEVLAENAAMLGLARKLGFSAHHVADDPGCVHVEIRTGSASATSALTG